MTRTVLSQRVCLDKTFVVTKMILVAAPANDIIQSSTGPQSMNWSEEFFLKGEVRGVCVQHGREGVEGGVTIML